MLLLGNLFRYLTWPILLFGFGGAVVHVGESGAGILSMFVVLAGAISFSFISERLVPYQVEWNRDRGDTSRDWLHALINLALNRASLWLLPLLAWMVVDEGLWPTHWPYVLQVVVAVLILDLGIAAAHHASHCIDPLWRFHAVHHSPTRLYGFNGLMKHPLHQGVEVLSGVLPLLLLGIPVEVATTLPFLVTIALLCQHSNSDIRSGWFRYLFANAEVHRFHHRRAGNGDINFGLFTTLYDHLVGTFEYAPGAAPRHSEEIGIQGRPDFPVHYLAQLAEPFGKKSSDESLLVKPTSMDLALKHSSVSPWRRSAHVPSAMGRFPATQVSVRKDSCRYRSVWRQCISLLLRLLDDGMEPAMRDRPRRDSWLSKVSNMGIQLPSHRGTCVGLTVVCLVVAISVFIELLGWRIITPGLSLPDAWNLPFFIGVSRTVGGATLLGVVVVILGIMVRPTRSWSLASALLLWSSGAGVFLLAMAALVAWAP